MVAGLSGQLEVLEADVPQQAGAQFLEALVGDAPQYANQLFLNGVLVQICLFIGGAGVRLVHRLLGGDLVDLALIALEAVMAQLEQAAGVIVAEFGPAPLFAQHPHAALLSVDQPGLGEVEAGPADFVLELGLATLGGALDFLLGHGVLLGDPRIDLTRPSG